MPPTIIDISKRLQRAINQAYDQAVLAQEMGDVYFTHGACLIDPDASSSGRNTGLRNVIGGKAYSTLHAEQMAIRNSPLWTPQWCFEKDCDQSKVGCAPFTTTEEP